MGLNIAYMPSRLRRSKLAFDHSSLGAYWFCPAARTAALDMLTSPVITTTCTRVPGMRFPDPRVQALLSACCALALRPAGFTSRDLRHLLAPQLGKDPGDMTGGQISYDLRRLRAHQIIERIPHSRTYQLTADGLSTALFFTRLTRRVIIPALADLAGAGPRPAARSARPTAPTRQPSPTSPARPHSASSHHPPPSAAHIRHQSQHATQVDSTSEIPAGKETYALPRMPLYESCNRKIKLVNHVRGIPNADSALDARPVAGRTSCSGSKDRVPDRCMSALF